MKIDKSGHFLVLVPHRDTRPALRVCGAALLKAGAGAYPFPCAAPLAALSRPLNAQELKNIAHALRKAAADGKFRAEGAYAMPFPSGEDNSFLFGPRLNFSLPPDLLNGLGEPLTPAAIGACLLTDGQDGNALPCPPALSFSAAAVANMLWQSVSLSAQDAQTDGAFGYKWEIGKLSWLPKKAG